MLGQKNRHKDCIFSGTAILDCYVMAKSVSDLDLHDLVHFRSGICIQKKDANADLLEKEQIQESRICTSRKNNWIADLFKVWRLSQRPDSLA
jgi:hypothetical protein